MSLHEFAVRFGTYSIWSLEFLFLPQLLFAFLIATASLVTAFFRQRPLQSPQWRPSHWLVLTQLLFFPVVISLGVLYPAQGPSSVQAIAHPTANQACDFLGWLSLALGTFWIYRMKGFRWFAASLVAVFELVLFGSFAIAGMAITGDWL